MASYSRVWRPEPYTWKSPRVFTLIRSWTPCVASSQGEVSRSNEVRQQFKVCHWEWEKPGVPTYGTAAPANEREHQRWNWGTRERGWRIPKMNDERLWETIRLRRRRQKAPSEQKRLEMSLLRCGCHKGTGLGGLATDGPRRWQLRRWDRVP